MENRKRLPVGESSFKRIRTEGYLYVDKTKGIVELLQRSSAYFLSRPRRFGKSLLISILRDIFQGKRELFKDLWIDKNSDWEWKEHPVIVFDFNGIAHSSPSELKNDLDDSLCEYANENGFELEKQSLQKKFKELIVKLYKKTGQGVVILIDEYDKPIIDFLSNNNDEIAIGIENREILKSFYGVLKDADVVSALRFIFITGISKFSKISLFSELNNLYDLTMKNEVSDLLGYTQEELITNFPTEIDNLASENNISRSGVVDKLRYWYNGYRFSRKEVYVYNPFSILQVFSSLIFENYWFDSGSPSFLIKLMKEKNYPLPSLENIEISEESFSTFDIENLKLEAILFQTGYLTIKNVRKRTFTLGYPNQEVKSSLANHLFTAFSEIENNVKRSTCLLLIDYLEEKKYEDFFGVIKSLYASIPYMLNSKRDEAYFHTIFYLMMTAAGIDARNEVLNADGRIDMVMEFSEMIYIIEFKCNQSAKVALDQIREKKYYEGYLSTDKEIYLAGINFDTDAKNVVEWDVVPLNAE